VVKAQLRPMTGILRYKEFEYSGQGLTFANHRRADPKTIVEALQTPNAPGFPKGKKCKGWRGAQVRLYGLKGKYWSVDGCRKVLQEALSKGPLNVPSSLKESEERLNKEYERRIELVKREAIERDEKYQAVTTDQEKARINLERLELLVSQIFRPGLPGTNKFASSIFEPERRFIQGSKVIVGFTTSRWKGRHPQMLAQRLCTGKSTVLYISSDEPQIAIASANPQVSGK